MGDISHKWLIYILGAIGVLLVLMSSLPKKEAVESIEIAPVDYCSAIEARLERMLPQIASVGKVSVMVTAKNYGEIKLAKDEGDRGDETVILSQKGGGEDTKIIEETYPEIQGVIIAADGGGNAKVKEMLTEAVMALLGVEAHKIKIFERTVANDF